MNGDIFAKAFDNARRGVCVGPVNMHGPRDKKEIEEAFLGFTPQQMAEWHMVHFGLESSTAVAFKALLTENKLLGGKLKATTRLLKIYEEGEETYRALYYKDRVNDQELNRLREENQSEKDMNSVLTREVDNLERRIKELEDRKFKDIDGI